MGVCVLTAHRVGLGLLGGSGSASPAPPAPPAPAPPTPAPRLPLSCSVVSSRRLCRQDRSPRSPPAVRMQLGGLWGAQSVRQPHPPIRERPRHPQETSRASATPPRPGSPPAGRANVGAVHSHPGPLVSRVLSFADVSRAVPRQRVSASFRSAAESAPAARGARVAVLCRPWPPLGRRGLCRCERPRPTRAAVPLLRAQAHRELPGHGPPATVPAPRCLRPAVLLPRLPLHVPGHPQEALLRLPAPRRSGACGGCSVLPSVLSGPMCPSSCCVQSRVTPEDPIF